VQQRQLKSQSQDGQPKQQHRSTYGSSRWSGTQQNATQGLKKQGMQSEATKSFDRPHRIDLVELKKQRSGQSSLKIPWYVYMEYMEQHSFIKKAWLFGYDHISSLIFFYPLLVGLVVSIEESVVIIEHHLKTGYEA